MTSVAPLGGAMRKRDRVPFSEFLARPPVRFARGSLGEKGPGPFSPGSLFSASGRVGATEESP